jgi:hypothetical protein
MAILALGTIATTCFASQIVNAQTMVPRKVLTCNSDDNVCAIAHPHSFATKNLRSPGGTEASSHAFLCTGNPGVSTPHNGSVCSQSPREFTPIPIRPGN